MENKVNYPLPYVHRFLVDAMHGKLGRLLRILGYDTTIANSIMQDKEIMEFSIRNNLILITEDKLFYETYLQHKYSNGNPAIALKIPGTSQEEQLAAIFQHLDLDPALLLADPEKLVKRCSKCNALVTEIDKDQIAVRINKNTFDQINMFWICSNELCQSIFWIGAHWKTIKETFSKTHAMLERATLKSEKAPFQDHRE